MSSFHQHIQWETSTLVKRSNSDELYPLSSESNTTRSTTPDAKNGEKAPNDFLIDKDQDFETWSNRNDLGNGNALNNIDFNESNQFEIEYLFHSHSNLVCVQKRKSLIVLKKEGCLSKNIKESLKLKCVKTGSLKDVAVLEIEFEYLFF